MSTTLIVVIVAVVVIAIVAFALYFRKTRTRKLRAKFGPEYDRVVGQEHGDTTRAEAVLEKRQKRIEKLDIRRLSRQESDRFSAEWRNVQELFVDHPQEALQRADSLVGEAMTACGYPGGDFEQRAVDISVEHARAVEHYRTAHDVAVHASRGETTTEDLRRAMQHYRSVLEDILEVRVNQPVNHTEEVHR